MKHKRFLSLLTTITMLVSLFPSFSLTAIAATETVGSFTVTTTSSGYSYSDNLLTISGGGEYEISGTSTSDTIKVDTSDTVVITLDSLCIDIREGSNYTSPIEITGGGNVTLKLKNESELYAPDGDYTGIQLSSANLTITSADGDGATTGSLDATGGTFGAGIGSGSNVDMSGSITINGGTVNATGGYYAAGIGSGSGRQSDMSGSITINGGTVNATGGRYAAGIGCGEYTDMTGSITINGGTVSGNTINGAGIGSGWASNLIGNITINGGVVTGTVTDSGAGIGTGSGGDLDGNIIITGGEVSGTSMNGAGIGGGIDSIATGNIKISGGTVSGTATKDGSGIGVGKRSTLSGSINLSGGYMTFSSLNASAIGTAVDSSTTDTASINITGGYFADSGYTSSTVYGCTVADGRMVYANTDADTSGTYPCYVSYEAATLNSDGVYEIGNAGQLFWFASLVNGDTITAAETGANGILTADIDLESKEWTPIGTSSSYPFNGTFDGNDYTVSGLYINDSSSTGIRQALFGYNGGTIKNITVSGNVTGYQNVGGVVGTNAGTVTNCTNCATVSATVSVGGVVGYNSGTVKNCYNSGSISGTGTIGGIVGYNSGTVKNCCNSGSVTSTWTGYDYAGGVVGQNWGSVTNCCNYGSVSGYTGIGGVVADNNNAVSSCYNYGTVSGTINVGGVVGNNYANTAGTLFGTVTNCYYLDGTATTAIGSDSGTSTDVLSKTLDEFESGEVTYLLTGGVTDGTQAWYQTLGSDSYPVLDSTHGTVYYATACDGSSADYYYLNRSAIHAGSDYDSNGFCNNCSYGYEPATINSEGVYEISNAGQLFWFASLVNGDTTQEGITAANTSANAVLTANIDLSVTTSTHTSTEWTPIGTKSAPYKGTFDGNGKTISGLSITTAADTTDAVYVGLFGYINAGTVKDLTVSGKIDVSGSTIYAGGIVGTVHNSVLSNLTSNVDVTAEATVKGTFGGVAASVEGTGDGSAHSTMECCVNYGTVTASGVLDCVGGLTGFMNSATITNCENRGTVDTTGGTAANSGGIYTGGIIAYINNANAVVTNCVNVGEISGVDSSSILSYTGAIVGRINANVGEVSNCYYLDTTASTGVGGNGNNSATVETTAQNAAEFATGAAAWSLQNANTDYVWGQDLTSDDYPVLTSDTDKKVVKVTFYKSTTGIVLMESYTNADGTLSSYLTGSDYTFYSDFDLTNEIRDIGTLTFDTDTDIYVVTDHDLTILETNGGTILEGTNYTYDDNLLTVLTGGTYTISGTSLTDTIKVTASEDVAITLYGVNITSNSKPPMEITGTGTVTVKLSDENTLESTGEYYAGLQKTSTDNTLYITSADGDGKTTGKLTATGGSFAAGIGGGFEANGSNITISGGMITATGLNGGAGIGGGIDGSGTVIITGGTVNANNDGGGAGIGGGNGGSGTVTISGGTVNATGGSGAGIGGGNGGSGTVTISGGTVTADSNTGAGIGGGESGSGAVTITGGTITAGSKNGAGLGTGTYSTTATTVDISGGYITISNKGDSADYIGSGNYSTGTNTVTITGGYFADSSYDASTVYSNSVASGYTAYANVEDTKGDYPARVLPTAWTAAVTYTTSGADGTAPSDDTNYGYGAEVTVDATLPLKKDGYAQTGWSLSSTDTTAVATFNISGDTTLYPVFARQFTDSGASDISLTYGEAITAIDLSDYIEFVDDTTFTSTSGEFTFALASGSELPAGLTLNEGIITGTPTAAAEAQSVSFTVTDKTPYIMLASLDSTPATVSATLTLTFTVAKAASSVATAPTAVTGLTYNGSAQELVSAGTVTGGEMQYSMSENGTYSAEIPTGTNAGDYTVYYKVVGDDNHNDTVVASIGVTIAKADSSVTTAPAANTLTYTGSAQALVTAGTADGGEMQYSMSENGTYSADIPTATDAGTYTVYYKAVGDDNHTDTVVASIGVTIAKADSSVTTAPAANTLTYNGSAQELVTAGTADGGEMQYSMSEDGTYSADIPTGTNAGEYTVYYKVVGDDNHSDTAVASIGVTIGKATPAYTVPTGLTAVYGDTLASVTLPTGWTWDDGTLSVGSAGDNEFAATFTPSDKTNYETVTENVTVTVAKADQAAPDNLSVTQPDEQTSTGTITGVTTAMEYSTNGGSSWTAITGDTLTLNPCTVLIRYAETTNYNAGATVEITISASNPSYTIPTDLTATYGDTLADVTLPTATNGTWTWEDEDLSVGNAGTNTFTAIFTPNDGNHNTVYVDVTVTVAKAMPTYTVPTGLAAVYGDTLSSVTLPTGWTWDDGTLSVGNVGDNEFAATFTPSDKTNYNTVTENVTVTVAKAIPTYTVPTGLTATYGDTLASVTLPDNWTWDDNTLSVGNVGDNEFAATFTPSDKANYETVTENVTVTVEKAIPTYTVPTGLTAVYGDTLEDVTLPTGWAWVDAATSVGNVGDNEFAATFTPSDKTNYETVTENVTVTVEKADQAAPDNLSVTQPDEHTSTGTITGVTTAMEYSINGGSSWTAVAGDTLTLDPCTVLIRYAASNNYNAGATVEIIISASNPSYTIPTDLTATYGDTLADVTLPTATNGTWTWEDEDLSVGNAGTNTFTAIFIPNDGNHNTVYVDVTVTVAKAMPTYTVPTGLTAVYGDTLASVTLPTGWTWDDDTLSVGNAGENEFAATFTPDDKTNYETMTADLIVTVAPLPIEIEWDYTSFVYDGSEKTVSAKVTNAIGDDEVNPICIDNSATEVGSYEAAIMAVDNDNYTLTGGTGLTNEWTIEQSAADGSVKTYNGETETSAFTYGDTITVKAAFSATGTAASGFTLSSLALGAAAVFNGDVQISDAVTVTEGDEITLTVDSTDLGAGNYTLTLKYCGDYNIAATALDFDITIAKAEPTVTLPTGLTAVYGDTLANVTLPDNWTWTDATASAGDAGTHEFEAVYTPADVDNYNTVTADLTVTVEKAEQSAPSGLTVTQPAEQGQTGTIAGVTTDMEYSTDGSTWTAVTNDPLTVDEGTVYIRYAESGNYNAGEAVEIVIASTVPTYEVPTGLTAVYGDTLAEVALPDADNGVWTWEDDELSVGSVGDNKFTAIFTPADSKYDTVTVEVTVTVEKAEPSYEVPTGLTAVYGDKLSDVTLPNGWTWDNENLSVGEVGENEFAATYTPSDDNYNTVTANISVTVTKAEPTYEVPTGLTAVYGDTLASVTLPDGWTWEDENLSVGNAGTNTFTAIFTPGDDNYNVVTVEISITVEKAEPSYEVPTGLTAIYGDTLASVALPDNWTWADATASVGGVGDNTFAAIFTPEDVANYNTATEMLTVTVEKAEQGAPSGFTVTQPDEETSTGTITGLTTDMEYSLDGGDTWEEITDDTLTLDPGTVLIRYAETDNCNAGAAVEITIDAANPSYTTPTDLTAVYGDTLADVTLPDADNGTWTWENESLSVGNAGTNTFTAIFTPNDDNHNTVTVEVSVTVAKAEPSYEVPTGLTAVYGDILATVTLPTGWKWADAAQSVGDAGTNTFTAIFTPEDSVNYETVTAEIDIEVGKATPTYELPTGLTANYGDTLADVALPDGWAWADATQSVGDVGTNTFTAVFTPDDTENYNTVTAEITVTVSAVTLTVTEAPTAARVKRGNTLSKSTLSGGSVALADGTEISGTWAWADGTETMSKSGTYERTAVFTADDEAYGTVEAAVTVTVYTSGGGGGSSSGTTTYKVTAEEIENGDISFDNSTAKAGATVTITVTPDDGFETENITVTDASGNEIELTQTDDDTYTFVMPSSEVSISAEFTEIETETEPTDEPITEKTDDDHDCLSEKFTDVDTALWYHEYIDYVLENGLMNGTGGTTFEPNTATTRAMIVTILYRLEGEPKATDAAAFTDVADGSWYADAVAWAAENGIVLGYGDGTFGANDVITREQTAAILYRYANYKGLDTSIGEDTNILSYTDADEISEYAIPAMQWAVGTGLVNGKGNNTLDPQGGATRAETAAMLMRFIEAE